MYFHYKEENSFKRYNLITFQLKYQHIKLKESYELNLST